MCLSLPGITDRGREILDKTLNFIGIGAQKAGTTTLHSIFRSHPEIFVPVFQKEPHFFDDEAKYSMGYDDYLLEFFAELGDEKAVGEITPDLLPTPAARDRIASTLGENIKFIIILRHPVQRAISHYKMYLNWLWESESFDNALRMEALQQRTDAQNSFSYFGRGRYLSQIKFYLEVFHRKNFHFICFEDLLNNYQSVLDDCFDFLGVSKMNIDELPRANSGKKVQLIHFEKDANVKLGRAGQENNIQMPKGGWLINTDYKGRVRLIKKPIQMVDSRLKRIKTLLDEESPNSERINELYENHFQKDEEELSNLTGLDLRIWRNL